MGICVGIVVGSVVVVGMGKAVFVGVGLGEGVDVAEGPGDTVEIDAVAKTAVIVPGSLIVAIVDEAKLFTKDMEGVLDNHPVNE